MNKEIKIGKKGNTWFHYGYSFKHFSLGIRFDRRTFDLDLGFFWIGGERL
jgi:hypothetical protein